MVVISADIWKAFDSMCRVEFMRSLAEHGIDPRIRASWWRELVNQRVDVSLNGAVAEGIHYDRGGKQGSRKTPTGWLLLLDS
eukprot:5308052-Lingulodinium_polyedra.AAC.1